MLGRICLSLDFKGLECVEKIQETGSLKEIKPEILSLRNLGLKFEPSTNISPGRICPILVSSQHFFPNSLSSDRLIIPALWGLVPRWHKGNFRDHEFNTVNFRIENIGDSRMYKPAYIRGRRCVLMCEGYYEWQRVPMRLPVSERSIYFIHMAQTKGVKIEDKSTWTCNTLNLLHIAGIFDIWYDEDENPLYSFTIISTASDKNLDWLHPRCPVVLETQQQITNWLDFQQVPGDKALKVIAKVKNLEWYQVDAERVLKGLEGCNQPLWREKTEKMEKT